MTAKPQTTSIPKQTQVSLNYWTASSAVDGCEFSTTFQEPITLNAGDSINVRNSSLDITRISNDAIIIEEDQILQFEVVFYSMIRKNIMDYNNLIGGQVPDMSSSDSTTNVNYPTHKCWVYAKQPDNDNDTEADPNNLGFIFVNPLMSYHIIY